MGRTTPDFESGTSTNFITSAYDNLIKNKKNLKPFEKIKTFEVLQEKFTMSNGLISQTAKMKRNSIFEKYKKSIVNMFDKK